MRAVQLVKFGEPREALQYTDLPDPKPGPGEVVVKIEAVGVCGRDLVMRKGAFPRKAACGARPRGGWESGGGGVPFLGELF